ncbi:flavodoxin-dependent (E)-4-hydroxy-3-methylbut-2-enyl-diphosphate synthase, partial [Escherichia coli]|uniref:flavodoxin-dependent (E)-4-hydroxy-3-methylbut-2-enyl-diphosphate synthase n=1 Tax=Escherichia coli TaxID=562 RepID=UPI002B4B9BCA
VIGTVNALEQRLEDIITPMDVSIIGCVVNGPGEALVSTLGVTLLFFNLLNVNSTRFVQLTGFRTNARFQLIDHIVVVQTVFA